ncbi:hypothetical protein HKD37_19G053879 [Glycine soja]
MEGYYGHLGDERVRPSSMASPCSSCGVSLRQIANLHGCGNPNPISFLLLRCCLVGFLKQGCQPVWFSEAVVEKPRCPLKLVVGDVVPMERSSLSYTLEPRSRVMCLCNVEAPLVTSWTEDNPGRRFYGCGLYKIIGRKWCNYYEWHDPLANSCEERIIVTLMKNVDELKFREKDLRTKINDMKMKGNFLGIRLVFSWVCVFLLVFLLCSRRM